MGKALAVVVALALWMSQTAFGVITVATPINPDQTIYGMDADDGVLFAYGRAVANDGDELDAVDYNNRNVNVVNDQLPFSQFDGADGRDPVPPGDAGLPGADAEFHFNLVYDLSGVTFAGVGPADNQLKGISFGMGLLDHDTDDPGAMSQVGEFKIMVNGQMYDLTDQTARTSQGFSGSAKDLMEVLEMMPVGNRIYQAVGGEFFFLATGNPADPNDIALNHFLNDADQTIEVWLRFTQPSLRPGGQVSHQGNGVGLDIFALGFNEPGVVPSVNPAIFIPEPATAMMSVLGLAALAIRRRRSA